MGKWKDAFRKSLDPERQSMAAFEFGPPATEKQLAALESAISAKLPAELRDLLREFNGVKKVREDLNEEYFFNTDEMPRAGEYYREWDLDTTLVMELFSKVVFVVQENGYAQMWAMVVKPFATYTYGQVVSFDHDRIMDTEKETDLFIVNYQSLLELVQADFKDAG